MEAALRAGVDAGAVDVVVFAGRQNCFEVEVVFSPVGGGADDTAIAADSVVLFSKLALEAGDGAMR